jgi:hypothetical protein
MTELQTGCPAEWGYSSALWCRYHLGSVLTLRANEDLNRRYADVMAPFRRYRHMSLWVGQNTSFSSTRYRAWSLTTESFKTWRSLSLRLDPPRSTRSRGVHLKSYCAPCYLVQWNSTLSNPCQVVGAERYKFESSWHRIFFSIQNWYCLPLALHDPSFFEHVTRLSLHNTLQSVIRDVFWSFNFSDG